MNITCVVTKKITFFFSDIFVIIDIYICFVSDIRFT